MSPVAHTDQHPPFSTAYLYRQLMYMTKSALEPKSWDAVAGWARRFTLFCNRHRLRAFPVSFITVGMFCVDHCKRGCTSRTIKDILWALGRHSRLHLLPWLSPREEALLRDTRRGLAKHDHSVPKRKLPVTIEVILAVAAATDVRVPGAYMIIVMMMVAHDALLRGRELVALNVLDITWSAKGPSIRIIKSKSNKEGPAEYVLIPFFDAPHQSNAAAHHLKIWMETMLPAQPDTPLFPAANGTRMSKSIFQALARNRLAAAGYATNQYSAHSFRSGGATDLYHNNCRPLYIKFQGRWKSDAYIIYIRDNPSKTTAEVAKAFTASAIAGRKKGAARRSVPALTK